MRSSSLNASEVKLSAFAAGAEPTEQNLSAPPKSPEQ